MTETTGDMIAVGEIVEKPVAVVSSPTACAPTASAPARRLVTFGFSRLSTPSVARTSGTRSAHARVRSRWVRR